MKAAQAGNNEQDAP